MQIYGLPHYPSKDWSKFDACGVTTMPKNWHWGTLKKWNVFKGRSRVTVFADTMTQAKTDACRIKDWQEQDISCVYMCTGEFVNPEVGGRYLA
jgi:hypothetical protein